VKSLMIGLFQVFEKYLGQNPMLSYPVLLFDLE